MSELHFALLIGAYFESDQLSLCREYLEELKDLADTYGFEVVYKAPCFLREINPATYIGSGKAEELVQKANELKADLIIIDEEISPNQGKNLERLFKRPVIDRTELILEVFAKRAQTKEAKIQIELAKAHYQLPRLKRLWTHLSRQTAGGKGYLKGAGERQIEIDRRLVRKKITQLEQELKEVSHHRKTQRKARERSQIPTFAIVGYTNVGKSTLLSALTKAEVLIEDKLFATLDTTARHFILPNGQKILLIDTVGFIRKIPHNLVAAFRSTLEESIHTDVILHLIDVHHPLAEEQAKATYEVLKELGIEKKEIITALNKVDLIENKGIISRFKLKYPRVIPISAKQKEGFNELMQAMMQSLVKLRQMVKLCIPQKEYGHFSSLLDEGKVLRQEYEGNDILIEMEIPSHLLYQVEKYQMA
ncbi:MAG: GTPase HflX [Simkania negevensis]|nr:GTPase HflX [Simkania negevensis]